MVDVCRQGVQALDAEFLVMKFAPHIAQQLRHVVLHPLQVSEKGLGFRL